MNLKDYIGKFVRLRNGLKGYIGYEIPRTFTYANGEKPLYPFVGVVFSSSGYLGHTNASWDNAGNYCVIGEDGYGVIGELMSTEEIMKRAMAQNALVVHPYDGKFEILGEYQDEYLLKNVATAKISRLSEIGYSDNWTIESNADRIGPKPFKPEIGDTYYVITPIGIIPEICENASIPNYACFRTSEDALAWLKTIEGV